MLQRRALAGALWSLAALAALAAASSERAEVAGAVRFGALFAVHGAPAAAGARCGRVREHYGIQRVEATLQALDDIAADATLLPGLALGAELRDSCWAPPTALRQTIELVRDAIAPPASSAPASASARRRVRSLSTSANVSCAKGAAGAGGGEAARGPLLGVLGPGASSAAVQVQNLLQLFSIPQVSYSATSLELSERARFATFFRVVPSDRHQARLLAALLRAHNWTYVHAVHTDESYGQGGVRALREEAARRGVCVAREEPLRAAAGAREADAALRRLRAAPHAPGVCVCWCEGRTARALLAALARAPSPPLRLLASDGWADRRDVAAGLERAARGALTLRIRSPYLRRFDRRYHALSPHANSRNPWFQEFWEQKFNCTLSHGGSSRGEAGEREGGEGSGRPCTGAESLATDYTQEPKLALVVRGVYALAHALHDMRRALCGTPPSPSTSPSTALAPPLCAAMLPFNSSLYQQYLARVRFRAPDGGLVAFDRNGDPPPELSEYDVMELTGPEGAWRYERVGRWRRGTLTLRGGEEAAARRAAGVRAACGEPCGAGEWARPGEGRARCCWTCVACPALSVVRPPPRAGCRACPPGHRPDLPRTACLPSPLEWGAEGRGARATALAAGALGLVVAAVSAGVLGRHRRTPVVKASSRELCALLLGAATLCHCAALAAALRPSAASCAAARLGAPALGGVYAAVLARTVRVARLVAAAARGSARARLLSSRAQVSLWAALSAPGAAASLWSAWRWPPTPRVLHPGRARAVLSCGGEAPGAQLVPLAPALVLLAACAGCAVRTRRLPRRLNEARWVGAAWYAACVAWLAAGPLYLGSRARGALLCACASLSAGACVLLALGPRVWLCACRPQCNTRAHFLTATEIRCHLGRYRPQPAVDEDLAVSAHAHPSPVSKRHAGCQTAAGAEGAGAEGAGREACCAGAGERCARAAACVRVTRTPAAGGAGDLADVLIVLMHHHHAPPPAPRPPRDPEPDADADV